ncbi:uncharacterized protein LOC125050373 [Pieris napi]|uniref:uncharacterized protein LOC125050373 n=1 Tax=Pieris napi TaxID=78633 RepID=UPI001FB9A861|nr:uncharacterized protein LOC125050373 [Pieris napi]
MVSTKEEWGYYGLFKYIGRFSRLFGSFPFIMSSEPKVSTLQKYYGLFIILPWINAVFFYSLYTEITDITENSRHAWPVIYLIYTAFSVLYIDMAVWTAPTRIYSWISCLKNIEKILIRTKETDQKELFKCKVLTVYLITTLFAIFANSVKLCMELDKCTYFNFAYKFNGLFFYTLCRICELFLFVILIFRVHKATKIMNEELKKLLHERGMFKLLQIFLLRHLYTICASMGCNLFKHAGSHLHGTNNRACEEAEKGKACIQGSRLRYDFVPFGVETLGPWGISAKRLFKEITKRLVDITGD